jgi:hypothetical protein
MKKWMWVVLNVLLVLVIIAIILATWMPAIYTSDWFKSTFPKL